MTGTPSIEPADRPHSWLVRLDGMGQSHVDLDDPTRLVFDYVRRIGEVIDTIAPSGGPLRVLHVGGAGLTLPRYLAATRPGSRQVVLEPDADLTSMVREQLPLPRRSGISVRPVDGRAGIAASREDWAELVVVDAFARAETPRELTTVEAWGEVDRARTPLAPVVLNLTDRAPFAAARDVVASMRDVLGPVVAGVEEATWRGRRTGNLLLMAGVAVTNRADPGYRWLDERAVRDGLGGGTPLCDPERS